ncbi:MAG TPA: phosphoribosylanthranilate isomerase [Sulfurovum sp.]|nr:phosphoribosylanthranilate isomerase [Sulfurovum sp.]
MRVKICGITNLKDALHAIACGADALGFVFYENSPRYISPKDAQKIIKRLPPFVENIGLFVNVDAKHINMVSSNTGISRAQIHFDVDEVFLSEIEVATLLVIRAKEKDDVEKYSEQYRLVDAYVESYGGEGKRLNLDFFKGVNCSNIILAGGLTLDNVLEVKKLGFYGVDVSSGVESAKGKKDFMKVKQFIANAKSL